MCILLRRAWLLAPAMALLALSLPFSLGAIVGNPIWKEKAYLPGMAAIAMGVLGALVAKHLRPKGRRAILPFYAVGICGIVAVLGFETQLWALFANGTMLVPPTFSALCMILAFYWSAAMGVPARLIGMGWLCACGRLSYEIYLTHMFVVIAMLEIFRAAGAGLMGVLWYAPTIAVCWLLGWAVAKWISVPCDKAIRRRLLAARPAVEKQPVAI